MSKMRAGNRFFPRFYELIAELTGPHIEAVEKVENIFTSHSREGEQDLEMDISDSL